MTFYLANRVDFEMRNNSKVAMTEKPCVEERVQSDRCSRSGKICNSSGCPQGLLPNLPQYMIALLKILLAAAPTSKAKTDSINIMADVLPEEMP